MSLPNFFNRTAVAASQILHGFDEDQFKRHLESCVIGIALDRQAAETAEGQTTAFLLLNLLARLYPRVAFVPMGDGTESMINQLRDLGTSINPEIEYEDDLQKATFCIALGSSKPNVSCPTIFAGSDGWVTKISSLKPMGSSRTRNPFGASAAACFAAANAFRFAFSSQLPAASIDKEFQLSLINWEINNPNVPHPALEQVDIGEVQLIGVGAIGNAALWTLARIPGLSGKMHLIDPESIELSNLQRYVMANQSHVGVEKAGLGKEILHSSALEVFAHQATWSAYLESRRDWQLDLVMVAVDTAEDRRNVQAALPRRILNSWTQPGDIGISRHAFLGDQACLMCLYFPPGVTKNEDQLVAEAIGMSANFVEVRQMLYSGAPLSREFISRIAEANGIPIDPLLKYENKPLRALYTEGICGGALIELTAQGKKARPTEVPMDFQSALAGVILAAELVVLKGNLREVPISATTRIDLLKPLPPYLSLPAPKHLSGKCICQDEDYILAYRRKYPDAN